MGSVVILGEWSMLSVDSGIGAVAAHRDEMSGACWGGPQG